MKQSKEKTKAEIEIERLKNKPMSDDLMQVIKKKQAYVNDAFNKSK